MHLAYHEKGERLSETLTLGGRARQAARRAASAATTATTSTTAAAGGGRQASGSGIVKGIDKQATAAAGAREHERSEGEDEERQNQNLFAPATLLLCHCHCCCSNCASVRYCKSKTSSGGCTGTRGHSAAACTAICPPPLTLTASASAA